MKPYYEDDLVTIYHGDCLELLPELDLPAIDLVLTDPPYGVGELSGGINRNRDKNGYNCYVDTPEFIGSVVVPVIEMCRTFATGVVLTPGIRNMMLYPQPDSLGCFYQPAAIGMAVWGNADSQPILYYGKNPTRKNMGKKLSHVVTEAPEKNGHPCVKPLGVWKKMMVNCSLEGHTVLDPFMGSGTTLRAAKDLGRKAVGIEIDEAYCEIAAKRMGQEVLDFEETNVS
jgi:site-specific DNA-methyltransferase (adenine-specific)